jgi:hypothetical protein
MPAAVVYVVHLITHFLACVPAEKTNILLPDPDNISTVRLTIHFRRIGAFLFIFLFKELPTGIGFQRPFILN